MLDEALRENEELKAKIVKLENKVRSGQNLPPV